MINSLNLTPSNPLEAMTMLRRNEQFRIGDYRKIIRFRDWDFPNPVMFAKMFILLAIEHGVKLKITDYGIQLEDHNNALDENGKELVHAALRTLPNKEVYKLPLINEGEDNEITN